MYKVTKDSSGDLIIKYVYLDGMTAECALNMFISDKSGINTSLSHICSAFEITYNELLNKIISYTLSIAKESKIDAIKYIRGVTKCRLREAKSFVDALVEASNN